MAKKINYNSDFMSRNQDDRMEQLEERLTALYANATNEVKSQYTDFMAKYEKEDQAKQELVQAGKITEDEYLAWRKNEILKSNGYTQTVESMTNMLVNTDVAAMATINGELPIVVAESYNFVQSLGFQAADEAGLTAGTFQVYNARTVEDLIKDNPDLMPAPRVNIPEDKKWNKDRINREITQGIVQGKSIPQIADGLQKVTTMDKNAAIRNARTAMTGAENMGRSQAAEDLKAKGIPTDEVWSATYDDRTRDSHLLLDGTTRDESGYFGSGIIDIPLRFPGDPLGAPEEVYNCRCRLSLKLPGIDHSQDESLYEKFMKENYPEDYAALKSSDTEIAREEAKERALERQAELRAQLQDQPEAPVAEEQEPEVVKETREEETADLLATQDQLPKEDLPEVEWGGHKGSVSNKTQEIVKIMDVDEKEARRVRSAIEGYTDGEFQLIRQAQQGNNSEYQEKADRIEAYIEKAPKWDGGEISRGLSFSNPSTIDSIIQKVEDGEPIDMMGMTSWSSNKDTALNFADADISTRTSVIFVNEEQKCDCATSIQYLSNLPNQDEVLVSGYADFQPARYEEKDGITYIYGNIRRKNDG